MLDVSEGVVIKVTAWNVYHTCQRQFVARVQQQSEIAEINLLEVQLT